MKVCPDRHNNERESEGDVIAVVVYSVYSFFFGDNLFNNPSTLCIMSHNLSSIFNFFFVLFIKSDCVAYI